MRIAIAAPAPRRREGGVANVVHCTAEALTQRGHEVTCLFREDVLPESTAGSRFEAMYFACRLAALLRGRRREFDVVNIHAPAGFAYGLLRRSGFVQGLPPYVMLLHGLEERRNHVMLREAKKGRAWHFSWKNRMWRRIYSMPLYRWSITTADHAVVINRETWSALQLKYNREVGRVWYIPNGVQPGLFIERQYAAGPNLRLLFVGTWLDHKGVYYLRDTFEILARSFPDVQLTIGGCITAPENVAKWFSQEAQGRVTVLPFVSAEEMPALYAQHDIFVFPSLMEGLPIVLLEAMASGMPVVTTETCGMMDIVENEFNGLLVRPADASALVSATGRMIESVDLRTRLGRAARETMKRHSWNRVAVQLEDVFTLAIAEEKGK
jgi:glycosyltransferase involved in cell wall biosynthesis